MAYKGRYRPTNPQKYKGDPTNIVYRSSWELKYMKYLDHHDSVIEWSSEEFFISYKSPMDGKWHRYFPDFKVKIRTRDGSTKTLIIEIKPLYQTQEPKKKTRITKKYLNEVKTYAVNYYKWKYAKEWCEDRKYEFHILTEKHLGIVK